MIVYMNETQLPFHLMAPALVVVVETSLMHSITVLS